MHRRAGNCQQERSRETCIQPNDQGLSQEPSMKGTELKWFPKVFTLPGTARG